MGRPKRMRAMFGVLKGKVSLIKATLILSTASSSFQVAVVRATTHHPIDPPPDYILDDVLAPGRHRPTSSALVEALLRRPHRTQSAFVALKCLLTLHHILRHGSPVLKDQFFNHRHLLNLSTFRDASDSETLKLSKWVQWHAEVIQKTFIVSDSLGFYFCSPPPQKPQNLGERFLITKELNSFVGMVEQICRAPDSLFYQRISMAYEVMKLIGEDYRTTLT